MALLQIHILCNLFVLGNISESYFPCYQLSGSGFPSIAINCKSNSEGSHFAQTVFAQTLGIEQRSKQNDKGFNRLYIYRIKFEAKGYQ